MHRKLVFRHSLQRWRKLGLGGEKQGKAAPDKTTDGQIRQAYSTVLKEAVFRRSQDYLHAKLQKPH